MAQARAARLPIIIHCRPSNNSENAWDDTIQMLRDHWASAGLGGILHCFTGEWKHAQAALDMGFYISYAVFCLKKKKNRYDIQHESKRSFSVNPRHIYKNVESDDPLDECGGS